MKKIYFLTLALISLGISTVKAQYNVLLNFDSANGSFPEGSLTHLGSKLYGVTFKGGAYDSGCVFSIDTNGLGYRDLLDFNGTNGACPIGKLIVSGGVLYGMTELGSNGDSGCVYALDTNGSRYRKLLDFNGANGWNPVYGSLIISGNRLYGMTESGGVNLWGNIFSIDTNGDGYKDLLDFNVTNGLSPTGSLILSGNMLYGMTSDGGANNFGNIFSIDTNGNRYKDMWDFNDTGSNGALPYGSLTISGAKLYGMTNQGGVNLWGNIFCIDTNGVGYKDLLDFNKTNGFNPVGSFTLSGNLLYGMTSLGGVGNGNIFSIDTGGSGYKDLFDFDSSDGEEPGGDITISGKVLYGMTSGGGLNHKGVIFRFGPYLCQNNYNQSICIVTTDTSINKNVIIWGRNNLPPDSTHSFVNIYDSTVSGWVKIGTVSDTALSEYIDTASNPSLQSYSYKISTVDSCGESSLSPTNSTIYLQVALLSNRDSLYWTPYVGFATPHYLIYRGLSLNALTLIDSVSGSTFNYVDTLPPAGSMYLVEAINPSGGCIPTHRRILYSHESGSSLSLSNGGIPKKLTGIASITSPLSSVRIIPNPNNGKFNLLLSHPELVSGSQAIVEVYNTMGEKVYDGMLKQVQHDNVVDLSSQSSGVYLYRLLSETGDLISQGKFVIGR